MDEVRITLIANTKFIGVNHIERVDSGENWIDSFFFVLDKGDSLCHVLHFNLSLWPNGHCNRLLQPFLPMQYLPIVDLNYNGLLKI
ncbi:hypothetical protein LBYZC6_07300 [Lacrimispora brassicae]